MKYGVTLIPGVMPRSIGLTLRMTRVPKAVAAPSTDAGPITPTGPFFLDTYQTNGPLANHVADTGQTYADLSWSTGDPVTLIVQDGAVGLDAQISVSGSAGVVAIPPSPNYSVEATAHTKVGLGSVRLGIRWTGGVNGRGYFVSFAAGSTTLLLCTIYVQNGTGGSTLIGGTSPTVADAENCKVKLEANGARIVLTVDGVAVTTVTDHTIPEAGTFMFWLQSANGAPYFPRANISRLAAVELVAL